MITRARAMSESTAIPRGRFRFLDQFGLRALLLATAGLPLSSPT
jgi:hypothetical protein